MDPGDTPPPPFDHSPVNIFFVIGHYEDLEETDSRVKYLWAALTAFSNEDRSRFLRFVTGRRRLPAPLYLCPAREYVLS